MTHEPYHGLLSEEAKRQRKEVRDPAHPRIDVDPMVELEHADAATEAAGIDEQMTAFDPDTHPKAFRGAEGPDEPVADNKGRLRDIMADTGPIDELTIDAVEPVDMGELLDFDGMNGVDL